MSYIIQLTFSVENKIFCCFFSELVRLDKVEEKNLCNVVNKAECYCKPMILCHFLKKNSQVTYFSLPNFSYLKHPNSSLLSSSEIFQTPDLKFKRVQNKMNN